MSSVRHKRSYKKFAVIYLLLFFSATSFSFASSVSENHELLGEFNYGSGNRSSENHDVQFDQLRLAIGGVSSSEEHNLQAWLFDTNISSSFTTTCSVQFNYYENSQSMHLSLSCDGNSGCMQMQFSNDNITWSNPEAFSASRIWQLSGGDGQKTVYTRFRDCSGNWSQVYTYTVILDTVIPSVSITPGGGLYTTTQQVTISASEVATIYYTTNGSTPTATSSIYTAPLTLSTDTKLNVLVVDRAGNQKKASETYTFCLNSDGYFCTGRSSNYQLPFANTNYGSSAGYSSNYQISRGILSKQPVGDAGSATYDLYAEPFYDDSTGLPSCGLYINNGAKTTSSRNVMLGLICSDANGCSKVAISNNSFSFPTEQDYSTSSAWILSANDGEKRVYVKFKDGETPGNWSGICSASIILDTKSAGVTASPVGGTFMSAQAVTLTATEPGTIYYTTDGNEPSTNSTVYSGPITISANEMDLKFFAVDTSGNQGTVKTEHYTICNGSNFTITGRVYDAYTNTPIQYAKVKWPNSTEQITGADGIYTISGLPKGYYSLEYVKLQSEGYVTYQKELMLCNPGLLQCDNHSPSICTNDIPLSKNATVFGTETPSGYSWGSVNTSTGNYVYEATDLSIPGIGIPFAFERTYNSQDTNNGPLGYGWTHTYNISLTEAISGDVTVRWGDGKTESWVPDGLGGYTPRTGVFNALTKDATYFIVRLKNMMTYNFDVTTKKLVSIVDENGNTMTFSYSGDNISNLNDTVGRIITFAYDGNNRITGVYDPVNRSVTFSYDVNGNLVSSTDLDGNTTNYSYDSNRLLLTITDPLENIFITNTYDTQRWVVISQKDALGAETLYSYDLANKTTQIIDPFGNSSYHQFDDLLRLTRETDARGNSAFYTYDERGDLSSVKDKNGNVTTYEYDGNGNVTKKIEPLGKISSAVYNADNNPTRKTDSNGNTTYFEYSTDGKGNLVKVTYPLNGETSYTYDSYGQVLTVKDALNGVTTNHYDIYGNKIALVDAINNTHTFEYDYVGRKIAEFHPLGSAMGYEYDDMDRLVAVTDALGGTSSFTYDANGNKTEHIDAKDNKIIFVYDKKNRLVSKTSPLSETETYTYDQMDRRTSVKNPRGFTSNVDYDAMGNVIHEIDALGNLVQHEYDANGNRTKTTDAMGNITVFDYDALNRLVKKTDHLGNYETYTYDYNGNKTSVTDALGKTTYSTYDELNRLKTVKDPLDNMITNEYDALGRLLKVTDAKNNNTRFEYDALGRMVKVTDAAGGVAEAKYDEQGNRTELKDTLGNKTKYIYDVLNRLTQETDPLGNLKLIYYDAVGNLITFIDLSGETAYTYDKNNRVTDISYPDSAVSYSYDANGNRKSVTDNMGTTSYAHDHLDRISAITDPFGKTVGYTYDPNGKRTSTKYPGNRPVFYYYDELNRLLAVEDWGGVTTWYDYDDAGRLTGVIMGNDSTVTYTYDDAGRLTDKVDKTAADALIASYHYDLDPNGNRTGMSMNQPLVPKPDYVDTSFTHNEGNQVISGGGKTYAYDVRGNRISRDDSMATTQYMYNFNNRLTKVIAGANTEEYRYNSDGKRLSSVIDGLETRYLLDLNSGMENVIAEMDSSNFIKRYYIYGDGLLYSVDGTTGERLYYHYDPLGSTVAITDSSGNITDKYAYLPFGELNKSETNHSNPFTYVGKFGVMREKNGLYFMRARFYDPETRRFMSVDPVKGEISNTQTLSPYSYVLGNPFVYVDPEGKCVFGCIGDILLISYGVYWVIDTYLGLAEIGDKGGSGDLTSDDIARFGRSQMPGWGDYPEAQMQGMDDALKGKEKAWTINPFYHLYYNHTKKILSAWEERNEVSSHSTEIVKGNLKSSTDDVYELQTYMTPVAFEENTNNHLLYSDKNDPNSWYSIQQGARERQTIASDKVAARISANAKKRGMTDAQYMSREKKQQRKREAQRQKELHEQLMISQSKYSVLVYDLAKLPSFNSGNRSRVGVYGKR